MEPVNDREWLDDQHAAPQRGLSPTPRQIEVFLTVLEMSGNSEVGGLLGRLGARNAAEAARLLWEHYPELRERMVLPHGEIGQRHERRRGQRRRDLQD